MLAWKREALFDADDDFVVVVVVVVDDDVFCGCCCWLALVQYLSSFLLFFDACYV